MAFFGACTSENSPKIDQSTTLPSKTETYIPPTVLIITQIPKFSQPSIAVVGEPTQAESEESIVVSTPSDSYSTDLPSTPEEFVQMEKTLPKVKSTLFDAEKWYEEKTGFSADFSLNFAPIPLGGGGIRVANIENGKDSATEAQKTQWYQTEPPQEVTIARISLKATLEPVNITYLAEENSYAPETPNDGLATPKIPIKNNVEIHGHSRWNGQMRDISNIQNLQIGDEITIRRDNNTAKFAVVGFILYDYADENFSISNWDKQVLTLQTTAEIGGDWILDPAVVIPKLTNQPIINSGHRSFIVVAEPLPFNNE